MTALPPCPTPSDPLSASERWDEILLQLKALEATEDITILYACESGSRAWGFASTDSDYDVRFIYVRPLEWYLSISERKDTIERPLTNMVDLAGWDLKKALRLFRKSNPPLMEWLGSPIVYVERGETAAALRRLADEYYSPKAAAYHYLHMARGNFRNYLQGETVWRKKYLYVLRPLLAVMWLEAGRGRVPVQFETLFRELPLDEKLKLEIHNELLVPKLRGRELGEAAALPRVGRFIQIELKRRDGSRFAFDHQRVPAEPLDELFRETLHTVWTAWPRL